MMTRLKAVSGSLPPHVSAGTSSAAVSVGPPKQWRPVALNCCKLMQNDQILEWLKTPAVQRYLGRAAAIKFEVLAMMVDPNNADTLAAIAARHGVSRQNVDLHFQRAKILFDEQGNLAPFDSKAKV